MGEWVMGHLDARLGRRCSAVSATLDSMPAMQARDEPDDAALALCLELARVTGATPLQWRMVRLIGPAVGKDVATADMAIACAVARGWLIAAGNPAHSIRLTDAGRAWSAAHLRQRSAKAN
jgi:hypothetical protein